MFLDTNALVYARFADAPNHATARDRLQRAIVDEEPLSISRQIIREYLAVATRPQSWSTPLALPDALVDVNRLADNFHILEDGPVVTEGLVALLHEVEVGGRQVHDANIVATMLAHGERRLFTFNTADFLRYGDRIELVNH